MGPKVHQEKAHRGCVAPRKDILNRNPSGFAMENEEQKEFLGGNQDHKRKKRKKKKDKEQRSW